MNNKGFTLMEAMIVAVIIAIAASLAVPGMSGWMQRRELNSETRRLASNLQLAKSEAVTRNQMVFLRYQPSGTTTKDGYDVVTSSGVTLVPRIRFSNSISLLTPDSVHSMGFNSRGLAVENSTRKIGVGKITVYVNQSSSHKLDKVLTLTLGGGISIE